MKWSRTARCWPPWRRARPGSWGRLTLLVGEEDRAWAAAWLAERGQAGDRPLVAIHPGAGAAVKQWPPAAWAAVASALAADPGAAILITGGAGERPLAQAIRPAWRPDSLAARQRCWTRPARPPSGASPRCKNAAPSCLAPTAGRSTWPSPSGCRRCTCTVPVSWRKFGPWGNPERHVVLQTDWGCAPCNRLDWPAADLPLHRCMEAITVPQVVAAARRLL